MTGAPSPTRWAIDLSKLLNAALGIERFPVDVPMVAMEFSKQRFPDDPVSLVKGRSLGAGFDGALIRAPATKKGWGIFYNSDISSQGRINFTLAHEFGHYLVHRFAHPNGIECADQDVVRWDSAYRQIEHEANVFAANLLMPFDDYRRQIDAHAKADLDMLSGCAERYRVSLIAAILRWLEYTHKRAVLGVSRDGFILWSRSSPAALKTGAFFRMSGAPLALPTQSLAARQSRIEDGRIGIELGPNVWLREGVREMTIFADQYDFAVSLLLLSDDVGPIWRDADYTDVCDRFADVR